MPLAEERKLKAEAKKKGYKPGSIAYNRYVYGTLAKQKKKKRTQDSITTKRAFHV
jgi:hypothetical protein